MAPNSKLVSTIIPVYNRPDLLTEAVESVLAQTHRPIEIIIVDDGSTDNTSEIGKALAENHPNEVSYVRQTNQGVSVARNAGIQLARGEFIQFLDSDDLLMPEKFSRQVAGLLSDPGCGISYCYTREYRPENRRKDLPGRKTAQTFCFMFPEILFGRLWPAPAPLFRRAVVDAIGFFRDLTIYEDWEYECRAAAIGVELYHCKEFLADKRDVHAREGRRKGGTPVSKLPDYARVHQLIFDHAKRAGVGKREVGRFARKLFLVARKCAAAGFEAEAKRCLDLAMEAAHHPMRSTQLEIYKATSQVLGWQTLGRFWEWVDACTLVRWARTVVRMPSSFWAVWRHRSGMAWKAVSGQRISKWPQLLMALWVTRRSRQKNA